MNEKQQETSVTARHDMSVIIAEQETDPEILLGFFRAANLNHVEALRANGPNNPKVWAAQKAAQEIGNLLVKP